MEDTYSCTKPQTFLTKSKNNSHFIYKAIVFAIFIFILPHFLPQFSKTKDRTGKWELIQLILVGVAVYGLFNRINKESDENYQNIDRMDSYLSNIFQVSSFFDDIMDYQSGSNDSYTMKVWKSQYLKRDPLVVFEQRDSSYEKPRSSTFEIVEKPLFLPLRSLNSRNLDLEETDNSLDFDAKAEENCVLQSPAQCNSKPDLPKTETKNETNEAPLFPLLSLSCSIQSKSDNWDGSMSMNSTKGEKLGKSVRTIRKFKSSKGDLQNRGFVEERGIDLVSERRTCLEIFDFRDYEKGINYNSEGFNCNNESGEGRDVDKKADEFIAKFREQIRLQRT